MSTHKNSDSGVIVVVLAGSRDFGRCPIASRVPTALWPVIERPALGHLLACLAKQGIGRAVVSTGINVGLLKQRIDVENGIEVEYRDEPLPVGTAGCVRDAVGNENDGLIVVIPATIVCPPDIDTLTGVHCQNRSDLTVVFNPGLDGHSSGRAVGIYVCSPNVLRHIPKDGYCDIKEGLIPDVLRSGETIHTVTVGGDVGCFRDWRGYLSAVSSYLGKSPKLIVQGSDCIRSDSGLLWTVPNAQIARNARLFGPVVVMDGARILDGAVVFGPTVVGRNSVIGKGAVVVSSVLWDSAQVGCGCEIQHCLLDDRAIVAANTVVRNKAILYKPACILTRTVGPLLNAAKAGWGRMKNEATFNYTATAAKTQSERPSRRPAIQMSLAGVAVFGAFLWSFWPVIGDLWKIWQRSDEYSSGILVPFLAAYILWSRRGQLKGLAIKPCLWGLLGFLFAEAVRFFGLFYMFGSAERLSVALGIAAMVLLLLGWEVFRKVSTVLLFLLLMLPWPNSVQAAVGEPLQRWATSSSVFCLETMGYEVVREGNILHMGEVTVAIAEACNGLRMVTAFFVISGLVVMLVRRQWWEKIIVFTSSLPIALLCNTLRLTVTAVAFTVLKGEYWERVFHDFGGYAMMPLALAAVVGELWFISRLTVAHSAGGDSQRGYAARAAL